MSDVNISLIYGKCENCESLVQIPFDDNMIVFVSN